MLDEKKYVPNQIDIQFNVLMNYIKDKSLEDIKNVIKQNLLYLRDSDRVNYTTIVNYYNKFKLWGTINLEDGDFELIENNALALVEHREDFEWLYASLSDYRSKKILLTLLYYWLMIDYRRIDGIIDKTYSQYFDLDIIKGDKNEVFVDIGSYMGETAIKYAEIFGGDNYKRIYCYDIVPVNVEYTNINIERAQLKNVIVREKGVSNEKGESSFYIGEYTSTSKLSGEGKTKIETVTIDEDIDEPVTFIKMDIEGGEEKALLGCRNKILESHPKLALSVYHCNDYLWKLARIINEMDPSYKFYLLYYGDPLLPTEYLLYAI
jgi:FkbM family methyltransferase